MTPKVLMPTRFGHRRFVIAQLEELGFDNDPAAQGENWRALQPTEELEEHLRRLSKPIEDPIEAACDAARMAPQPISPLEGGPKDGRDPWLAPTDRAEGGDRARSRGDPPSVGVADISPSRGEITSGDTAADDERGALIARLERLGYDDHPDVRAREFDWRLYSAQSLRIIAENIEAQRSNEEREKAARLADAIETATVALTLIEDKKTRPAAITRRCVEEALTACLAILEDIQAAGASPS